jgi:hypothetical protein
MVDRVDVITTSAASMARHAGGWIFDLAMLGWDVAVHVTEPGDPRPLLILGAHPARLDRARLGCPQILVVDARLYRAQAWVARRAQESAATLNEVRLWGEERLVTTDVATTPVLHRLSVAARAFKAQALAEVDGPAPVTGPTETLHRLVPRQMVRTLAATTGSLRHSITAVR